MKKRILSLLLAFSMAATLAPATALVGSSVSEAAVVAPNIVATYKDGASAATALTLYDDAGIYGEVQKVTAGQVVTLNVTENAPGNTNASGTVMKFGSISVDNGETDAKALLDTNSQSLVTALPTTTPATVSKSVQATTPGFNRPALTTGDFTFTAPTATAINQFIVLKITTVVDELKWNGSSYEASDNRKTVVKYAKLMVSKDATANTTTDKPSISTASLSDPVEIEVGTRYDLVITDAEAGNVGDYVTFTKAVSGSTTGVTVGDIPIAKRTNNANEAKTTSKIYVGTNATVGQTFSVTYTAKLNGNNSFDSTPIIVNFKVVKRGEASADTLHFNAANGTIGTASSAASITMSTTGGSIAADLFEKTDAYALVTRTAGTNLKVTWSGNSTGTTADQFKVPASAYAAGSFTIPALTFNKATASQSGKFTYDIDYFVAGVKVNSLTVDFATTLPEEVVLNADGGVISDVRYELNDNKMYVGGATGSTNNWSVYFPIPRKEGYVFRQWVVASSGATESTGGTETVSHDDLTFKAIYTKNITYNVYSGIGTGGKGQDDNKRWGYELLTAEIGKPVSEKVPFTRNGYTFMGWSTEPNTSVALWGTDAKITNELLVAMESAGANDLYAVWKANTYTINFIPNTPPGAEKLSTYKDVAPITKGFGAVWTAANLPKCTYAFKGYTFSHWSAVVSGDTTDSKESVVVGGVVTDESLGNKNGDKNITLRAIWVSTGASTLNKNESEIWTTAAEGTTLPLTTSEVGRVVKEWTKQDNSVSAPDSDVVGAGANVYTPTYGKYINYDINYTFGIAMASDRGIENIQKSNSDQDSFTIEGGTVKLSAMTGDATAQTADSNQTTVPTAFKGYFFVFVDSDGAWWHVTKDYELAEEESDAMITMSFDSKKMAALLDAAGNGVTNNGGNYVSNTQLLACPVFAAKVTGAKIDPDKITLKYGTPLSVVANEGLLGAVLTGASPATSSPVEIDASAGGLDFGLKVVNDGGYNPIPEKDTTYTVTYRITPYNTVSSSAAFYDRTVKVTVQAVEDADVDKVFGLEYGPLKTIDLPKGSNVYDVYAALTKNANIFPVKASNKNSYNVDLAEVGNFGTSADWKVVVSGTDVSNTGKGDNADGIYSTHADEGSMFADRVVAGATEMRKALPSDTSYTFIADMSAYAGLSYQLRTGSTMDYDSKYAYIQVNIGSGSDPTPTPSIEVDDIEKVDSVTTSEAQVHALLDSNYMLRFRNKVTGAHLYTADFTEYVALMVNKNWEHETYISGSNTFKASSKKTSVYTTPVYRLFSSANREHLYTKDFGEVQSLVAGGKWILDNSTIYVSMNEAGTAYYRQVRNVPVGGGKSVLQHNWAPKAEYDANLANGKGWRADFDGKPVWYSPAD